MALTYKIWDKTSPINGCEATVAMEALKISITDEVYIIVNEDGTDWILQTQQNAPFKGATIESSAQNHIDALIAEQTAAEEVVQQPTQEDRIAALEAAILALMGE